TVAHRSNRELRMMAYRQSELDAVKTSIEATVEQRTIELAAAKAAAESHAAQLVERTAQLHESQTKAELANQAKSAFLANMSHEIRRPLTAIIGYCDILRDSLLADQAPPQRIQATDTIRRAGEHLLTVINDILDLSKIEAGKLKTEQTETSLSQI